MPNEKPNSLAMFIVLSSTPAKIAAVTVAALNSSAVFLPIISKYILSSNALDSRKFSCRTSPSEILLVESARV